MPFGSTPQGGIVKSSLRTSDSFGRTIGAIGMFLLALICLFTSPVKAQVEDVVVVVADTTGPAGERNSVISVFLDNYRDTIAGIELWLRLSRPDLIKFQTDTVTKFDTTYWDCLQFVGPNCVDSVADSNGVYSFLRVKQTLVSVGSFDTTGTLLSGYQYLDARSLAGNGLDLKVTGIADVNGVPGAPVGILPQSGGLLFRLLADISYVPDTLSDRIVTIYPDVFLDHLNFSRPNGTSIGVNSVVSPDSNFYRCTAWLPPGNTVCLNWQQVPGPPYDSLFVGLDTSAVLDTTKIKLFGGNLTVGPGGCGNIDGDPLGSVDIGDLTFLVDHLFITFTPLPNPGAANLDCDSEGSIDIGDLTVLVDHLFITFTPFCCAP